MTGVRRWAPLLAVVALLGAAMLASVFANPVVELAPPRVESGTRSQIPSTFGDGGAARTTAPPGGGSAFDIPTWVTYLISGICLGVVGALLLYLAWLAIRTRIAGLRAEADLPIGPPPTLEETRDSVRNAVEAGLAELDDDGDPRRAVIACWLGLERAAAAAGMPRMAAETSTDLVGRLLENHLVVRAEVLAGLAELYREARYAPHVVDASMREQAREAMLELRAELSRPLLRPLTGGSS